MLLRSILIVFIFLTIITKSNSQIIQPKQIAEILIDLLTPGKADPGDRIRYNVTIENAGVSNATDLQLNINPDPRTTLVPGSFRSSPLAIDDAYDCTGNVGLNIPSSSGLLFNDFDDNPGGLTCTAGTFTTLEGGSITILSNGSFTYIPPVGFNGIDTYVYTLIDSNPVGGTVPDTDIATVTFTVSNLIWFIDNSSVAATSDGRRNSPFKTLTDFNAGSSVAADIVYLEHTGTNYTGGIVLQDNERLFGEAHSGGSNLSDVLPFVLAPNSIELPSLNISNRPVITNISGDGVTLAMNNTLIGFDIGACSDFGIENGGTSSVGNLIVSDVIINNNTGGGFDASDGSGSATNAVFTSISSSGGTNGIILTNCAGAFTVNGGTINNPTLSGVLISGGSVVFSSSGSISNNSGFAVDVDNHDTGNVTFSGNIISNGSGIRVQNCNGGTKTFSGNSKSLSTTTHTAVSLISNNGASLNFSNGGLDINTTTGTGFLVTGGGLVGVDGLTNTISTVSGKGVDIQSNTGSAQIVFASINSISGQIANIINSGTGIKNLGRINTSSGATTALNLVNNGAIHIGGSIAGSITTSSAHAIVVNNTSLQINSTGLNITATNSGIGLYVSGGAVSINSVGSAAAGLRISTSSGVGLNATSGGTITIGGVGAHTINSISSTALNVSNTTIGASGLNFQSISSGNNSVATDPANGIVLSNTGSIGGLTVTGTGIPHSGGTIQNTTGHGISLTNTVNPSFNNIQLQNIGGSGIKGTLVNNFSCTNSLINNTGTAGGVNESNISFNNTSIGNEQNLSGMVTIHGNVLTNSNYHGINIFNFNGTISEAIITNNTLVSSTSALTSQGAGISLIAFGSSGTSAHVIKASISNNTLTNWPGGVGIQIQGGNNAISVTAPAGTMGIAGHSTNIINIAQNIISGQSAANRIGAEGILTLSGGRGQGNFQISGNSVTHTTGTGIACSSFGLANVTSIILNNTIQCNNSFGAQGIGAGISQVPGVGNTPIMSVAVTNNNISATEGNGILIVARDCNGSLDCSVQNNTVDAPTGGVRPGIRIDAGNATGNVTVCTTITGNTSAGSGGSQGIGLRKQGTAPGTNIFGVVGMTVTSTPNVESFVAGLNPSGGGVLLISATSGFTNCTL